MKKIILKTLLAFTALLFVNCQSNDDSTKTEAIDPRLPNQEVFKPAIQLVPKKQTAKVLEN